jgi:hypothetical protein
MKISEKVQRWINSTLQLSVEQMESSLEEDVEDDLEMDTLGAAARASVE